MVHIGLERSKSILTQPDLRRMTRTRMDASRNLSAAKRNGGVKDRPSFMIGTLVPKSTPDVKVASNPVLLTISQFKVPSGWWSSVTLKSLVPGRSQDLAEERACLFPGHSRLRSVPLRAFRS